MKFGDSEVKLLSDGSFTLDPGAAFGIVPTPFWSSKFKTTEAGRVRLAVRIPYIVQKDFQVLIDSGIGGNPDPKYSKIFEMEKGEDLVDQLSDYGSSADIDMIIHSHLHFDHFGHSLDRQNGRFTFKNASLVAQKLEFNSYRNPVDFTRVNYGRTDRKALNSSKRLALEGSTRLKGGVQVIHTGGHTAGHQVIIYSNGGKEMIYFGDLVPTAFHLKPTYVTAIDTSPLDSVEMKKKLLERAIRKHSICIFNHDMETPAALISGTLDDIKFEAVEL